MSKSICVDKNYSTTHTVTTEKPALESRPNDKFDTVLLLPKNNERKGEGGLRTQGLFKKSYPDNPLVSIITVVFNGVSTIEQTINSVLGQSYDNVEYIIIDGGSTDGTLDILQKYNDVVDYWVSEPDEGIYDAMNKGLALCMGEYIGIINSDDFYQKEIFRDVVEAFKKSDADVIYGDVNYLRLDSMQEVIPAHCVGLNYRVMPYSFIWLWLGMAFCHQASFVKKFIYKKHGAFDTSFKIAGDYDFFLRIYKRETEFYYLRKSLANFRDGGVSAVSGKQGIDVECAKARLKNAGYLKGGVINIFIEMARIAKSMYKNHKK